jgi:hypothetical protein
MDPLLQVYFDGCPGLQFNQGEDRTITISVINAQTKAPISLAGAIVGFNLPLQGGGNVKRTNGPVSVGFAAVNITPANSFTLPDHGFVTGDPVQVAAQVGGTLPGGLAPATNYLINVIDVNTFQITDTSGNVIPITTQGTIGFAITNSNDLVLVSGDLGQVTFNLRADVSEAVNAALSQNCQFQYTLSNKTRIAIISSQLDVMAQPDA